MANSMLAFDINSLWAATVGFASVVSTVLFSSDWRQSEFVAQLLHTTLAILRMKHPTASAPCCSGEDSSPSNSFAASFPPGDSSPSNSFAASFPPGQSGFPGGKQIGEDASLGTLCSIELAAGIDVHTAVDQVGSFRELSQSLPESACLSCETRKLLIDALQQSGAVMADAECAVDVAVACCDPQLGDAALMNGIRLGCGSAWLAQAYRRLCRCSIPVQAQHAADVARLYGCENRGDLAVDFWLEVRDAGDKNELAASRDTVDLIYGAALEACVINGDLEVAARAARAAAWRAPPCIPGQAALLTIARWLARRQDLTPALECYDCACKVGAAIDLQTYRSLLAACVRNVDMAQASEIFRDLVASGHNVDHGTFSTMIRGYCAAGKLEQAMTLLHLLRRRGMTPDVFLFNGILEGCCSRGMSVLAEQVLQDMEDVGVSPSNQTVAILVRLFGRARNLERSMEIFEEFPKRYAIELSRQTFGSVISVCLSHGRYDLATSAFANMKQAGCTPDARTYESLILGCLRQGDVESAVCLISDALGLSEGALPDDRSLLRTCLRPKLVEDVLRLIGRRRLAKQLGEPLVRRLGKVGFEVSESLRQSLLRSAETESESPCSRLDTRRAERQLWRDFSAIVVA